MGIGVPLAKAVIENNTSAAIVQIEPGGFKTERYRREACGNKLIQALQGSGLSGINTLQGFVQNNFKVGAGVGAQAR